MAEFEKKPLLTGQYAFAVQKKDGQLCVFIGPDPLTETMEDLIPLVSADRESSDELTQTDSIYSAIQEFIRVQQDEYVVVHNPSISFSEDYPNGGHQSKRNDMKDLVIGRKKVITAGHFPLWPRQWIERREIHHLSANQYLMVEVESTDVDVNAPYYNLTVRCANIETAIIDESVAAEAEKEVKKVTDISSGETTGEIAKKSEELGGEESKPPEPDDKELAPSEESPVESALELGQRIIIPGNLTPVYIPPTGIEIVRDDAGLVVRDTVVLGPTEFCVIRNKAGEPEVYEGPGRVFPGPYDVFETEGSRNRVYDAYHIRPDRGILLRTVTDILAEKLCDQLPKGIEKLEKADYHKGDEIFLSGFDAYVVPSSSFEIINPDTRQPHIGNDHSNIYVQAIGIDQKSGVYVADVNTGNVELVRGKKKLLLDPRRSKHVERRVPAHLWNLMIGKGEPHKKVDEYDDEIVTTPWALSISIPNNEAVLVTSKDGRRSVMGPCLELLDYEEVLEILTLSQGKEKTDEHQLETCFLRVTGNRVTDLVKLKTSDRIAVNVRLEYGVQFEGETDEDREKWFNHKDYVMLLCTNLRSRLRAAAHMISLTELDRVLPEFVRDTILGKKGEEEHRPGLLFSENNMRVEEVEVLTYTIEDEEIAYSISEASTKVVTRLVEDAAKEAELASEEKRAGIGEKMAEIDKSNSQRESEVSIKRSEDRKTVDEYVTNITHELAMLEKSCEAEISKAVQEIADEEAKASRERDAADRRTVLALLAKQRANTVGYRKALTHLRNLKIGAMSEADEKRLLAIQPKLIEALQDGVDKKLMAELASNLPQATGALGLFLGKGGIDALKDMVKDTRFERAINALSVSSEGADLSEKGVSSESLDDI
ncbi:MAG: hypothetical protein U9M90_04040 [Patescibacteria group bacterium]|nr:hypothetical protein [Patescibacteria group bacterium]